MTIVAHLASALDAAHAAGIVHRPLQVARAVLAGVGEGEIAPDFAQQVLRRVDAVTT